MRYASIPCKFLVFFKHGIHNSEIRETVFKWKPKTCCEKYQWFPDIMTISWSSSLDPEYNPVFAVTSDSSLCEKFQLFSDTLTRLDARALSRERHNNMKIIPWANFTLESIHSWVVGFKSDLVMRRVTGPLKDDDTLVDLMGDNTAAFLCYLDELSNTDKVS